MTDNIAIAIALVALALHDLYILHRLKRLEDGFYSFLDTMIWVLKKTHNIDNDEVDHDRQ